MSSQKPRLLLAFTLLCACAALVSLGACVGDEPASIGPSEADASTTPPTPGQDSGPPDTSTPDAADGGLDAGPKRFCQTQAPLTGVTDFFCADFDGTKADEGFTQALIPDGGAVNLTTDAFFSPPASFTNGGGARLLWEKVGGLPFLEMEVHTRINVGSLGGVVAPSTGYITILELESIDATVELRYTRGGNVEGGEYTGYYLDALFCPNACGGVEKRLSNTLPLNVWTDVQLVWQKTGAVEVAFNGVEVGGVDIAETTSTKASVTLGVAAFGAPVGVGRHAYDNLVVSVRR